MLKLNSCVRGLYHWCIVIGFLLISSYGWAGLEDFFPWAGRGNERENILRAELDARDPPTSETDSSVPYFWLTFDNVNGKPVTVLISVPADHEERECNEHPNEPCNCLSLQRRSTGEYEDKNEGYENEGYENESCNSYDPRYNRVDLRQYMSMDTLPLPSQSSDSGSVRVQPQSIGRQPAHYSIHEEESSGFVSDVIPGTYRNYSLKPAYDIDEDSAANAPQMRTQNDIRTFVAVMRLSGEAFQRPGSHLGFARYVISSVAGAMVAPLGFTCWFLCCHKLATTQCFVAFLGRIAEDGLCSCCCNYGGICMHCCSILGGASAGLGTYDCCLKSLQVKRFTLSFTHQQIVDEMTPEKVLDKDVTSFLMDIFKKINNYSSGLSVVSVRTSQTEGRVLSELTLDVDGLDSPKEFFKMLKSSDVVKSGKVQLRIHEKNS
ncbi:hypothetical protein NX722_13345 [Endozoicomonas gorgoniicola]|uniref:Uncharacterized protein n=1 Tax=Endozoicomonas gorgoniicola TaxID=1234144 RepID=A0ABT3MW50_9GAMM|nr:hypothetical protein [Endozoicomonas gorgoniicola]MCW7553593.1 hypothetical protein [Endozoicomonas gorgoniicola]